MLGEWDVAIAKMSNTEIEEKIKAFAVLRSWPAFEKEFKGFGIFSLKIFLENELNSRSYAINRGDLFRVPTDDIHCPTRYFREYSLALGFVTEVIAAGGESFPVYHWCSGEWHKWA
jgi:hypothetical protein